MTPEYARECLSYEPDTGALAWKERPVTHFSSRRAQRSWNTRFAGRPITSRSHGYLYFSVNGKNHKAHRVVFLLMEGRWPKGMVDHINHVRDDNRWCNLREVDGMTEQQRNLSLSRRNRTGVIGVHWANYQKQWKAMIGYKGKNVDLGYHRSFFEAVCARKSAELKYGYHENHGK